MRTARSLILIVVVSAPGCRCSPEDDGNVDTHSHEQLPSAMTSVRRPPRTYFVAHGGAQCSLYWVDGGKRSVDKEVLCPRELDAGERMRLAGRVCLRLSDRPDRNVPVRCLKEMFYAERDDAQGSGEWHLPLDAKARAE